MLEIWDRKLGCGDCECPGGLTSSCAVVLQLVTVHSLLGVRPFPEG